MHHTFSQIDCFRIDNKLLHCVSSCDCHPIAVSDHAPTSVDTPDVSSGTLWEALKATVRGQVISYISQVRRTERSRLEEITDELGKIDEMYSVSPSPTVFSYIQNKTNL